MNFFLEILVLGFNLISLYTKVYKSSLKKIIYGENTIENIDDNSEGGGGGLVL